MGPCVWDYLNVIGFFRSALFLGARRKAHNRICARNNKDIPMHTNQAMLYAIETARELSNTLGETIALEAFDDASAPFLPECNDDDGEWE